MHSKLSFDGQVVVVTGSGRGIGRAHALTFATRGASVVVNDISRADADAVVEEIAAAGGVATATYDSVTTPDGGRSLIAAAVERFGTVDVLVNNAGFLRPGYFDELSEQDIREIVDVHLLGAFWVTKPAWDVMKAKGYGRVILTSSNSGMLSHHATANYAAAKAGLYGLMRALAFEGQEHGIQVNAILPVAATTIAVDNPIPDFERYFADTAGDIKPEQLSPMLVAALVVALASPKSAVTGEAFSAVCARYGRVFVGIADGWLAEDPATVSPEAVLAHMDEIRDIEAFSTPAWGFDELTEVMRRVSV